jgi:hypothetical protein
MADTHTVKHQADERERSRRTAQAAGLESPTHPLLELQQIAGNRAVQRLVTSGGRPAQIQRVLSPATSSFGHGTYSRLLGTWAGLQGYTQSLQGQALGANAMTSVLLGEIQNVMAFLTMAQAEPAPPGASSPQVPATAGF